MYEGEDGESEDEDDGDGKEEVEEGGEASFRSLFHIFFLLSF